MDERITFDDLKAMDCDWISAKMAASALRMNTGRLIKYAKDGQLEFATRISGDRVLVGRVSLLRWVGLIEKEQEKKEAVTGKMDEILKEIRELNIGLASAIAIMLASNPEAAVILDKLQETMRNGGTKQ